MRKFGCRVRGPQHMYFLFRGKDTPCRSGHTFWQGSVTVPKFFTSAFFVRKNARNMLRHPFSVISESFERVELKGGKKFEGGRKGGPADIQSTHST